MSQDPSARASGRPPADPGPELPRDGHLALALKHAPDHELMPPPAVDEQLRRLARQALPSTPADWREDARPGWRTRWQRALQALTRPAAGAAFASLALGTAIVTLWRDQPVPSTQVDAPPASVQPPVKPAPQPYEPPMPSRDASPRAETAPTGARPPEQVDPPAATTQKVARATPPAKAAAAEATRPTPPSLPTSPSLPPPPSPAAPVTTGAAVEAPAALPAAPAAPAAPPPATALRSFQLHGSARPASGVLDTAAVRGRSATADPPAWSTALALPGAAGRALQGLATGPWQAEPGTPAPGDVALTDPTGSVLGHVRLLPDAVVWMPAAAIGLAWRRAASPAELQVLRDALAGAERLPPR